MSSLWSKLSQYASHHVMQLENIGWDVVKIVLLFIVAQVIIRVLSRVIHRLLHLRAKIDERRKNTLEGLFQNIVKYTVYFIVLLTVLPMLGVHIAALLAGAGVAGIAIAFGAQSLLKDLFNGMFVLFEDQYGVGDYVNLNGVTGQVRLIGLRITVLKVWTGELVTIPNGQITQVINYSKENSIGVVDINVGYQANVETAIDILAGVMNSLRANSPDIVGEPSVLGVQSLNDSTYTIRATVECRPYTQFAVVRRAQEMVHRAFLAQGIDLPVQKVVYMPDRFSSSPTSSAVDPSTTPPTD